MKSFLFIEISCKIWILIQKRISKLENEVQKLWNRMIWWQLAFSWAWGFPLRERREKSEREWALWFDGKCQTTTTPPSLPHSLLPQSVGKRQHQGCQNPNLCKFIFKVFLKIFKVSFRSFFSTSWQDLVVIKKSLNYLKNKMSKTVISILIYVHCI